MGDDEKNKIPEMLTDGTDTSTSAPVGEGSEQSHFTGGGFSGSTTSDTFYWGRCDSGGNHRPWKSPRCDTYDQAYALCTQHNESVCDSNGASVTTF